MRCKTIHRVRRESAAPSSTRRTEGTERFKATLVTSLLTLSSGGVVSDAGARGEVARYWHFSDLPAVSDLGPFMRSITDIALAD